MFGSLPVVTLLDTRDATHSEKDEALEVRRAAEAGNAEAVRDWVARHEGWQEYGRFQRPMAEHLKAVILQVARYYEVTE